MTHSFKPTLPDDDYGEQFACHGYNTRHRSNLHIPSMEFKEILE